MNLKNYTSSVAVETTIARIEQYLIGTGLVTGIGKEYKGTVVQGLVFQIVHDKNKLPITVKLSANVAQCQEFFWLDHCRTSKRNRRTKDDFADQAARTAWKLQEDWVRVETSLIMLQQRTVLQSFMSCVWDGERTFYQRIEAGGFKQLATLKGEA
jgi:hypothetical protein